jgi:hypothetical protein
VYAAGDGSQVFAGAKQVLSRYSNLTYNPWKCIPRLKITGLILVPSELLVSTPAFYTKAFFHGQLCPLKPFLVPREVTDNTRASKTTKANKPLGLMPVT